MWGVEDNCLDLLFIVRMRFCVENTNLRGKKQARFLADVQWALKRPIG